MSCNAERLPYANMLQWSVHVQYTRFTFCVTFLLSPICLYWDITLFTVHFLYVDINACLAEMVLFFLYILLKVPIIITNEHGEMCLQYLCYRQEYQSKKSYKEFFHKWKISKLILPVSLSTLFILRIYRHYINQLVSKCYICILFRSCFWQTSYNACMNTAFLCKKRVVIICFLTSFLVVKALVYNWNNCTTKKENSCSCHLVELIYVEQDY